MKKIHYWLLFLFSLTCWLLFTLHAAPLRSGVDVFVFREAGWNLATHGVFESAALVNMRDLAPHFYSHYTPLFPLLFAASLKIFPVSDHSGALFNLLLGAAASATLLFFVLRESSSRLSRAAALLIALLPPIAMTYDRPEELGILLSAIALFAISATRFHPIACGLLVALVFLGHPYCALIVIGWGIGIFFLRKTSSEQNPSITLCHLALTIATFALILTAVALFYHHIDPTSLSRFVEHSFGPRSGLGQVTNAERQYGYLTNLRHGIFMKGIPHLILYFASVLLHIGLVIALFLRKSASTCTDRALALLALASLLATIALFPAQSQYVIALSYITPIALLTTRIASTRLRQFALCFLSGALLAHLPLLAINTLQQQQMLPSYRAALAQPQFLRSHIAAPDALIAVEYGSYDLYKPYFSHVIELGHTQLVSDFSKLDAVAVCYSGFPGDANQTIGFPPGPDPHVFYLAQPAPMHQWVTLFGHRIMHHQWGYGCDLYLRFNTHSAPFSTVANDTHPK